MESIKHKLEVFFLVLCLIAIAFIVWYVVTALPDGQEMKGTLVRTEQHFTDDSLLPLDLVRHPEGKNV